MTAKRAITLALIVAGVGLVLDRATKAIAVDALRPGERIPVVGDLLTLTLVYNPGAAFSLGAGSTWILTIIAAIAVVVAIIFAIRLRGVWWGVALGLILGGAIGNLIDRLTNPPSFGQGHVTDFIAYGNLFVGNVADILLVAGVALTCLIIFTASRHRDSNVPPAETSDVEAPDDPRKGRS